jgi:FtsP/CotA-like multicopper oxidase with cupredoxin domain
MMGGRSRDFTTPIALATLSYAGQIPPLSLPQKLLPIAALPATQTVRRFILNSHMDFTIDGKTFDENRVDTRVRLNTIEDWEIVNTAMMGMDHSFHLHTNAFQVISRDDRAEPYLAWRDTVVVRSGEVVRLRVKFADFPGKAIYHCHILDHSDRGMMGVIEMQA